MTVEPILYRKSRKYCVALSSASPVNTRTAEWSATRVIEMFIV